jgi:hypothetical protein
MWGQGNNKLFLLPFFKDMRKVVVVVVVSLLITGDIPLKSQIKIHL